MLTVGIYLLVFAITVLLSLVFRSYSFTISKHPFSLCFKDYGINRTVFSHNSKASHFIGFFLAFIPLMFIYTVRYGIGEDYFPYEQIYNSMREASISTYIEYHSQSIGNFYIEPFYYLLNKISPSYVFLQFIIVFLMSINIAATENDFPKSKGLIIYIFLCCHFIYSLNGTRYILGLSYVMLGTAKLLKKKYISFFVLVGIAVLFHKTFLAALIFYLFRGRKEKLKNRVLNYITIFISLCSFVLVPFVISIAGNISAFSRYFSTELYSVSESAEMSSLWVMHIIPVAITLVFLHKDSFEDEFFSTIFRIYILEVPFRFLAFYNPLFGRLARIPQIVEVFLVPYLLSKQKNKTNRIILLVYYVLWYAFYFAYYFWVDGAKDYQWIFNRRI